MIAFSAVVEMSDVATYLATSALHDRVEMQIEQCQARRKNHHDSWIWSRLQVTKYEYVAILCEGVCQEFAGASVSTNIERPRFSW